MQSDSAGIDIGASEIYVAVPSDRSDKPVRRFDTFTDDLHQAAKWLKSCNIKSITMESTGVYWIPVFQILDIYGFEVILVNARHVKNVPGRKTDVQACQWLHFHPIKNQKEFDKTVFFEQEQINQKRLKNRLVKLGERYGISDGSW
jgi:transposase